MRHRVFSVLDGKAKAFLPPFCVGEVGVATRLFSDMVCEPKHQFNNHPEDYTLFEVGLFDDGTALLEPFGPEMVVTGLQCVVADHSEIQGDLLNHVIRQRHDSTRLHVLQR